MDVLIVDHHVTSLLINEDVLMKSSKRKEFPYQFYMRSSVLCGLESQWETTSNLKK